MGELGAFLKIERVDNSERDPSERTSDYREFVHDRPVPELREQGARCMECGVPFCHNGCPLGNLIPDWNDLVYRDRWSDAIRQLHATNNFPEFTGRLCPAPCEAACVLEIREGDSVTIKQIENAVINRAWDEGWVTPQPPTVLTGRSVGVVGAGPAGLAAAQQLRRHGHEVTVYERDEAGGGLIRFGVPDFKIEKWVIERRLEQLKAEGVEFVYNCDVGRDITADELRGRHDAVVIAIGSRAARDLPVPGRDLHGIHFAMDYLYQRNRAVAREIDPLPTPGPPPAVPQGEEVISAAGKHVVVIGGGDTGADCVGNSHREGALSVTQLELLPEPPEHRPDDRTPWPRWPDKLRTSYALKEGGMREFSMGTAEFAGENGRVTALRGARVEPHPPFKAVEGTEFELKADLVLLAMGFLHPEQEGFLEQLGVDKDPRGNVKTSTPYTCSVPGVFAAGDARRGQSLIVWAINEGRQCARMVDRYLCGLAAREPVAAGARSDEPITAAGPPEQAGPGID